MQCYSAAYKNTNDDYCHSYSNYENECSCGAFVVNRSRASTLKRYKMECGINEKEKYIISLVLNTILKYHP